MARGSLLQEGREGARRLSLGATPREAPWVLKESAERKVPEGSAPWRLCLAVSPGRTSLSVLGPGIAPQVEMGRTRSFPTV